jgi:hypothetical protein
VPISSSPAAALEPSDHGSRFVWRAVGFLVAACLVVLGARYLINDAIPFLTDISSGKFGRFWPRRVWLLTHIVGSGLALLVGPFQLWSGLRQHAMLVHRWSGRLYVVGSSVALPLSTLRRMRGRALLSPSASAPWGSCGGRLLGWRMSRFGSATSVNTKSGSFGATW